MSAKTITNSIESLNRLIKSDPKKAGILTVLVVVLLVMVGRLVITGETRPESASAMTANNNASVDEPRLPALLARPSERRLAAAGSMQDWLSARKKPNAERNIFAVKLDYFPRDGGKSTTASLSEKSYGFWDQIAKSMSSQADVRKDRQILIENLQAQAASLKLQSTVMSAEPKALVNGELVKEGDVIASFRVEKIEARRIIVEREGIRLEIPMN